MLDRDQADAWLRALNDIRLVLGTRLEVTEDTYEEDVDPEDPRWQVHADLRLARLAAGVAAVLPRPAAPGLSAR